MNPFKGLYTDLNRFPEVSWKLIFLVLGLETLYVILVNLIIFPSGIFDKIHHFTNGLIQVTLLVNLVGIAVIIGGLLLGYGRLGPKEIGLEWRKLSQALIVIGLFWLIVQVIEGIQAYFVWGEISLNRAWEQTGAMRLMGSLSAQLLGNAFYEEALFRGFLITQFYLKFKQIIGERKSLGLALFTSQSLFAFSHIPNRIFHGVPFPEMVLSQFPFLFMLGLVFALIYHRTNNLFIAIGVHSLINMPTPLFNTGQFPQLWYYLLIVALLIFWPQFERLLRSASNQTYHQKTMN